MDIEELKTGMAAWLRETSDYAIRVGADQDWPVTEAEEVRGEELADEAESLEERAKGLGTDERTSMAEAFRLIREQWLQTCRPPIAIQATCALAGKIGA